MAIRDLITVSISEDVECNTGYRAIKSKQFKSSVNVVYNKINHIAKFGPITHKLTFQKCDYRRVTTLLVDSMGLHPADHFKPKEQVKK